MVNYNEILCPYCFKPFSHEEFAFRSDIYFANEMDIEASDCKIPIKERKKYLAGQSEKYRNFWQNYGGNTTEATVNTKEEKKSRFAPYDMPVIEKEDISCYIYDGDGFVVGAYDKYGYKLEINRKVCPHCHNPIPKQYGKFPCKRISIIGIKGSGKTVYISQLLKDIGRKYIPKIGLSAVGLSTHERNFTDNNMVEYNVPLPKGTLPETLCQPMFYDIGKPHDDGTREQYTIVLYDIAGENCENPDKMIKFSDFVRHSDGLILLLDPTQLGIGKSDERNIRDASEAVQTLHNVFVNENDRCRTPIAVCLSKSDMYWDILPDMVRDDVLPTGVSRTGNNNQQFNASDFNRLSQEIHKILRMQAGDLCNTLQANFWFYNYFGLSAIGCEVDESTNCPVSSPNPKRIEEPIFWLFKMFGFIGTNEAVKMPNPIFIKEEEEIRVKRFLTTRIEKVEREREINTEEDLVQYLNKKG